jgi:hypothetical protein
MGVLTPIEREVDSRNSAAKAIVIAFIGQWKYEIESPLFCGLEIRVRSPENFSRQFVGIRSSATCDFPDNVVDSLDALAIHGNSAARRFG